MSLLKKMLGGLYPPLTKLLHETWALLFPKWYIRYVYEKVLDRKLNLRNPEDFREKVQWLKIYSDTSQWTDLADKYKVREYLAQCGLSDISAKLYGVWERAEAIDFDKLPKKFVLKTNHGFGRILLVEDKSKLDIPETISLLNKWVKERYGLLTFEPHYWNIERKIIAEEFLQEHTIPAISSSLIDYKIYCLNGEPYFVHVLYDRDNLTIGSSAETDDLGTKAFAFDLDWNPRPEILGPRFAQKPGLQIPKPKQLDEMLRICRILAKPFPLVRIDLYEVNQKVYLGELTFTPGGGMKFLTDEFFLEMGKKVDLSKVKRRSKFWIT